jgi:hypothetical protein
MTPDRDDPLIDGLLDEVLGGHAPPDLTERIMRAWSQGPQAHVDPAESGLQPLPPPVPPPVASALFPEPPPVLPGATDALNAAPANGRPVVHVPATSSITRRRRSGPNRYLVTAAALAAAIALALLALVGSSFILPSPQVVKSDQKSDGNATEVQPAPQAPPAVVGIQNKRRPQVATDGSPGTTSRVLPDLDAPQVAKDSDSATPSTAPAIPDFPKRGGEPLADDAIVSFVNAELTKVWTENAVKPAALATDAEWCSRVFKQLLGRAPGAEDELKPFMADNSSNKRQKLVERLLTEERYVEQYARYWSVVWSNVLVGRLEDRPTLASREGLEQFLCRGFARNRPYHELVYELLTATGAASPGSEDYNPAVNFLLDGLEPQATVATARVGRVMLGQQLQCSQCHDHPGGGPSQEQFWALNACLRQMRPDGAGTTIKLVTSDELENRAASRPGTVFYETPTGLLKSATPAFLDGTQVVSSDPAQIDLRRELARKVVLSDLMSKALVNRVWSHFFEFGFTRNVDHMGKGESTTAPQVLDRLSDQFAAHNYDLKSLMRWIVLSDPFSRSSNITDLASKDMPEAGDPALFSRYYERPQRAEAVFSSLAQAGRIRKSATTQADVEKARRDWLAQLNPGLGGKAPPKGPRPITAKPPSSIMVGGDLPRRTASSQESALLKKIAASKLSFDKKVEHVFALALSREPSRREFLAAANVLTSGKGDEAAALEDIFWAIQNSNEFIMDH